MTQLSNNLVAVLRRRARTLQEDGYKPEWCLSLMRAADELEVHRKAAGDPERQAIQAFAEVRRLRSTLIQVFNQTRARKPAGWPEEVLEKIKNALAAVPEPGQGRRILSIQISDTDTRESIEAMVAEVLDAHFEGGNDGDSNHNDDVHSEPGGARGGDQSGAAGLVGQGGPAETGASGEGSPAVEGGAGCDVDQHPGEPEADRAAEDGRPIAEGVSQDPDADTRQAAAVADVRAER